MKLRGETIAFAVCLIALCVASYIWHAVRYKELYRTACILRAEADLHEIVTQLTKYKSTFGTLPVSREREILGALSGDNLKQQQFIDRQIVETLVDPWGTPYKISCHDDEVIVWSAGPNRKFEGPEILANDDVRLRTKF